jgi:hypothetical protein
VKVKAQQDGQKHQEDAHPSPVIDKKIGRIYFQNKIRRNNKSRNNQKNFGNQQSQRANRHKYSKKTHHLELAMVYAGTTRAIEFAMLSLCYPQTAPPGDRSFGSARS